MSDDNQPALSRRRFLQAGSFTTTALSIPAIAGLGSSQTVHAQASGLEKPNFLILMCDEMRFPPVYESAALKQFRLQYLQTQNMLRRNGVEFHRHYAASVACSPSRTSLYTGQYPSLHGVTQTDGAAKQAFDPDVFWLDPNSVPTMGHYFRAAGYSAYWRGKWHASEADMTIPGTHNQLLSYDPNSGVPNPPNEALYTASDRLGGFGFSGWIGPEPHGPSPLNSGSSVPQGEHGRDEGFARQVKSLIEQLDRGGGAQPWLIMASFVNPHDITLWGLFANIGGGFEFYVEPGVVPLHLFDQSLFQQTRNDNLARKPRAQASYQESYNEWMQPIIRSPATLHRYYRYYYQLHKNVDEQMMVVYQALLQSRFRDNTIVVFTSDHGDLLGSHNGMYQKWYTAYDEAIRVPMIFSNRELFPQPRAVDTLTSHVDLLPTLLGLAGIDPASIQEKLMADYSDARPLVGRDLSALVLGAVPPGSINDPLYFMTDDDPSRGLNQDNWTGIGVDSVVQPNHIETVIARFNDGSGSKIWKYSRYFDNPQFWSTPGYPGQRGVEDVVSLQKQATPSEPGDYVIPYQVTVKDTPKRDEFEMYNVSDDPMELTNLAHHPKYQAVKAVLAKLLQEQCARKRLTPCSGEVPGQPECGQAGCTI